MIQNAINSKVVRIFYGIILPVTVISFLVGIASINSRPQLLGSSISDLIVRLSLTLWFSGVYIRLAKFSEFSFYPNRKWSKSDVGRIEKYFYIGISLLFSLGFGVISWWTIQWFFPVLSSVAYLIAALNSFIVFFPMATQYWVLKL